jgi:hypothetical protein
MLTRYNQRDGNRQPEKGKYHCRNDSSRDSLYDLSAVLLFFEL